MFDPETVATREPLTRVGAEQRRDGLAPPVEIGVRADVLLEPRGAQCLAGTERQRRHGVRVHAEQRRGVLAGEALDLGVPEHFLPARREREERARRRRPVEAAQRGDVCSAVADHVFDRITRRHGTAGTDHGDVGVADGGADVIPEVLFGPAAGLDGGVDLEERLRDDVIGIRARERLGIFERADGVPRVQRGIRTPRTVSGRANQLGVAQFPKIGANMRRSHIACHCACVSRARPQRKQSIPNGNRNTAGDEVRAAADFWG